MSRVQLTKKEAIEKIDAILEKEFAWCVSETYNDLIKTVNENARAGKKKLKGSLVVGFNPKYKDSEDIRFDIASKDVVHLWIATLGGKRASLKKIEKFTDKYDLFAWDYEDYYTFAFKLFSDSLFGGMTKTGKMFAQQLNALLVGTGMKLSFKSDVLVSRCRINYVCKIPDGYKPKQELSSENINNKESDIDEVADVYHKLAKIFEKLLMTYCNNVSSEVSEENIVYVKGVLNDVKLGGLETPNKPISVSFSCNNEDGTNYACAICATIGKKPNVTSDEFESKLQNISLTFDAFGFEQVKISGKSIIFGTSAVYDFSQEDVAKKIQDRLAAIRATVMLDNVKDFIEQILD
ncbi:MAG: hypothetical protein IKV61_00455 [Clostridia bacterium]|nr:hypothetical protein [Clostridia bacterium]